MSITGVFIDPISTYLCDMHVYSTHFLAIKDVYAVHICVYMGGLYISTSA